MDKLAPRKEYTVHVYTDGAASNNHLPSKRIGGWATVMMYIDQNGDLHPGKPGQEATKEFSGTVPGATNNQMELQAILIALKQVTVKNTPVIIFTDSNYSIGVLTGRDNAKENLELISEIQSLMKIHRVEFKHVEGHTGNTGNERANTLAQKAAGSKKRR